MLLSMLSKVSLLLFQLDNLLIDPHAAWYTEESRRTLRTKAIKDVLRVLPDEIPLYLIPGRLG